MLNESAKVNRYLTGQYFLHLLLKLKIQSPQN